MSLKIVCLLGLIGFVLSQDYSCNPNNCSSATGYNRGDVIGCMYFCHIDTNSDNILNRGEYDALFQVCAGSGTTCEQATFAATIVTVIPICDTEANALWVQFALQDGDGTTFMMTDLDVMWDKCLAAQAVPGDTVAPDGYRIVWNEVWVNCEDPACTLPYP
jgi:hypothetical protein